MLNKESIIIWEKWVDPFGQNIDSVEWPGYDNDLSDDSDEIDDNFLKRPTKEIKKINAIITSMGIIPYNEHTDCTKIFNFWVGHTNFDISKNVASSIESIDGVETLDVFTRYRFRVAFGKAFNDRDVMNEINNTIYSLIGNQT
jgi:hypothetical protein